MHTPTKCQMKEQAAITSLLLMLSAACAAAAAYLDFGKGALVQEGLHNCPYAAEDERGIDNEHGAQVLREVVLQSGTQAPAISAV